MFTFRLQNYDEFIVLLVSSLIFVMENLDQQIQKIVKRMFKILVTKYFKRYL